MAAASRLGRQLEEIIATSSTLDARFALIGEAQDVIRRFPNWEIWGKDLDAHR